MKKIISFSISILVSFLLISCKKYSEEFYGPALGIAPEDFTASPLTVNNSNPNFISQKVYFESDFSATVRWKLTMVGETSGAIKILNGISKKLDSTNTKWDGSTDTLKVFKTGENVIAKLSVLGWKDTISTSLTLAGEKNRGILIGTFENINVDQIAKNWLDVSGLYWFFDFETNEKDIVDKIADPDVPTGIHALRMVGRDVNTNFYIGQVGLSAPSGVFNFGAGDLNNFYFNVYVKGTGLGAVNDTKFVIQAFEDDNGGGILYDGSEDKFIHSISLQYNGWKLHQVKYSDFVLDGATVANTYRTHSPDKIANIGFFFGANTASALSATNPIEVRMDHFSITTNGPMIP